MKTIVLSLCAFLLLESLWACTDNNNDVIDYVIDQDSNPRYLEGEWAFVKYEVVSNYRDTVLLSYLDKYHAKKEVICITDSSCKKKRGNETIGIYPIHIENGKIAMDVDTYYNDETEKVENTGDPHFLELYEYQYANNHTILIMSLIHRGMPGIFLLTSTAIRYYYKRI